MYVSEKECNMRRTQKADKRRRNRSENEEEEEEAEQREEDEEEEDRKLLRLVSLAPMQGARLSKLTDSFVSSWFSALL